MKLAKAKQSDEFLHNETLAELLQSAHSLQAKRVGNKEIADQLPQTAISVRDMHSCTKQWVVVYEQTIRSKRSLRRQVFLNEDYLLEDADQVRKYMKRKFRNAKILAINESENGIKPVPVSNVAGSNTREN